MHASFALRGKSAVACHAVTARDLKKWLAAHPRAGFLEAAGFTAKEGDLRLVPDAKGGIALAVLGLGKATDPFTLAAFSETLPPGLYRLEDVPESCGGARAALAWALGSYQFTRYRKPKPGAAKLMLPDGIDGREISRIADAVFLARDLINTPANDMGPAELARAAQTVAGKHGARFSAIVGEALLKRNYPLIHAVGAGSDRAPRLIDIRWGRARAPRVTLVGKGVCFDSGGYDIKTASGMSTMKKDMGGGAVALAVADMVMGAKLDVRLRLLIPAVENSVSGRAYRPGDIFKSRKGLTVEIGNTDAEGRLVLADALAEADSETPELLIDIATLTGAARVATGMELPPFFTDDEALAAELASHAREAHDPVWRLPLWRGYEKALDSPLADLTNDPHYNYAGAITAALFLNRFVTRAGSWVHLDIPGWVDRPRPGRRVGGEANSARAIYALIRSRYGKCNEFDSRITPARPDLAAMHLKGKIEARRFADGNRGSVQRGHCALRVKPDSHAAQETELLFGENFTVYEEKDGWAWGQAALDSYVGYIHALSLGPEVTPTHRVIALSTPVLMRPDVKASVLNFLPMNARIRAGADGGEFAAVNAGFVSRRHLAPLEQVADDWVGVAERFLGTPYVWGGKTHAGMDCSGLIQTALQAAGISSPRDTDMMEAALGHISDSPPARGDLIFWKGHVGAMLDETRLLHANAFHMEVAIEPLDAAIRRIGAVSIVKRP